MRELFARAKTEATFWLGRRLPTCQDLARVMSQSLERPLTLRERVTLRFHFLICDYCVSYLSQLRTMRTVSRARGAREPDEPSSGPPLSDEARERIKRALARGGGAD